MTDTNSPIVNDPNGDRTALLSGSGILSYGSMPRVEIVQPLAPPPKDAENVSAITLLKEMSWRKRLTAITASLVNFSSLACFAVMAPFLPLEADAKGIDGATVGMIFACFELVMFIATLTFGRFLTAIGARFMYISGILMAAICAILFGTLEWCPPGTIFAVMAILCRVVEAIGVAMCQTASMAIIANEFPDRVATMMGLLESFAGLGLMAGPPIGGALYEAGGFFLPFVVIGSLLFATGIAAALLLPKSVVVEPKDRAKLFRAFIKVPTVFVCGVCIVTCATMITFLDPTLSNQLAVIDPVLAESQALIGLVFLVMPALYAILSPFIGYFADTVRYPLLLIVFGNCGFILAYLLIGPCPIFQIPPKQLWLIIFSLALLGLFISFCFMPAFAAMNKACVNAGLPNDLDLYGLIAGFFGSAFNLGAFVGPLLGGWLVQSIGFEWAASIVALLPLIDLTVLSIFGIITWRQSR